MNKAHSRETWMIRSSVADVLIVPLRSSTVAGATVPQLGPAHASAAVEAAAETLLAALLVVPA